MAYQKKETHAMYAKQTLKSVIAVLVATFSISVAADPSPRAWDAEIFYQVNREAWVKTTTARVDVSINMTLGREGLAKARKAMLDNLQTLGKVDWQLTNFNRSRDQSGLEQVAATATARFAETDLDGLRERATSISRPGSNYSVSTIDFMPSLADMELARNNLRIELMQAVKQQLADVKKIYPDQNYQISTLNFQPYEVTTMQSPRMAAMMEMGGEAKASSAPLSISQKIVLAANVVLAVPNPKQ